MHIIRLATSVLGATAAAGLLAAPASADGVRVQDPADATASNYDVSKVVVRHGGSRLFVRVKFADLNPQGNSGMSIFIDTDKSLRGPEFRVGAGLFDGTDYNIGTMTGWRDNEEILACASDLDLNYNRETATYWVERACFDEVDQVRVGIKVKDAYDGSHVVTDWVPTRRGFTDWLAAG
ncbi:hypothetical protein [Nocardioides sp. LHG3406-4]|uniref:hypothetical protein n=1 Tax=Nocardioides sp. LHG3406-4 TaxID=2804575 RepID=UPI003CEF6A71